MIETGWVVASSGRAQPTAAQHSQSCAVVVKPPWAELSWEERTKQLANNIVSAEMSEWERERVEGKYPTTATDQSLQTF